MNLLLNLILTNAPTGNLDTKTIEPGQSISQEIFCVFNVLSSKEWRAIIQPMHYYNQCLTFRSEVTSIVLLHMQWKYSPLK